MNDPNVENVEVVESAEAAVVEPKTEVKVEAAKKPAPKKAAKKPAKKAPAKKASPKKTSKPKSAKKAVKGERRQGRPPKYVGEIATYIKSVLKKEQSLTYARKFLNASASAAIAKGRNAKLVPAKGLGISTPTLMKLADEIQIEFPLGRPSFKDQEKKGRRAKSKKKAA